MATGLLDALGLQKNGASVPTPPPFLDLNSPDAKRVLMKAVAEQAERDRKRPSWRS